MEPIAEMVTPLLSWYDHNARVLPFRQDPTPYHVWVSEVMLQQTRVETVLPYYRRFMAAFPGVRELADAPEEQLLKLWEGLGYYSRARNLQKAARQVVEQWQGEFPRDPAALESLPGIGSYTAGAIASIAFGVACPAVDGNVLRVVARLQGSQIPIDAPGEKKRVSCLLSRLIPPDRPGDFNQALMELGALVCLPNGAPKCGECPLQNLCQAHGQGKTGEIPRKKEKKPRKKEEWTILLLFSGEGNPCLALRKRGEGGLLSGLWELPALPGCWTEGQAWAWLETQGFFPQSLSPLPQAGHVFTHVEWRLTGYRAKVAAPLSLPGEEWIWVTREQLEASYPLPAAFRQWSLDF